MSHRKWLLAGLLLAAVAGVALAVVWLRPGKPTPPPDKLASALLPRPVALAPGVYLLGKSAPAANYAVYTSDGIVLIDSGLEADAAAVKEQLAELGLDVARLRAVLLTHVHADHSLGAAHLRQLTGAKIHAGRADSAPLRSGEPRDAFFSTFYMPDVPTHPTAVDVELAGGEAIDLGDAHFTAIAAPGHTPGSVCYLLERGGRRILFTGDVVQSLDPATEGVLGTYAAYLPPVYRGDAADYLATLRKLRELPMPDLVLPGHPRMDEPPQNPHVPAARWQMLLDRGIAAMELLLKRRQTDGANFLDGRPKELLPGLHYLGDFDGRAVYVLDTAKVLFLFDAPGGPPLAAFISERFKALGWENRKLDAVILTSADEAATSGLTDVVRATGCKVVAPKAGLEAVRARCPAGTEILTEADLEKAGWFEVKPIPLRGRGSAPVAYLFPWRGKKVLVSGLIPVKLTALTAPALIRDVTGPDGGMMPYLKSLERLEELTPDLWLPAQPVHGQNANVYDRDWPAVLEKNMEPFLR